MLFGLARDSTGTRSGHLGLQSFKNKHYPNIYSAEANKKIIKRLSMQISDIYKK